jgi:hypothetical protein
VYLACYNLDLLLLSTLLSLGLRSRYGGDELLRDHSQHDHRE